MAPETNGGRAEGQKRHQKFPLFETIELNTFGVGLVPCGAGSRLLFAKGANEVRRATHLFPGAGTQRVSCRNIQVEYFNGCCGGRHLNRGVILTRFLYWQNMET